MKPADKLTKLIEQSDVKISRETDDRILGDALGHLEKLKHEHSADTGPKNKISRCRGDNCSGVDRDAVCRQSVCSDDDIRKSCRTNSQRADDGL